MAKITDYIFNLFRSSKSDDDQTDDDQPAQIQESAERPADFIPNTRLYPLNGFLPNPAKDASNAPLTKTEVVIPYWLQDEDTLRDEGVLFGLSESDATEKTDIINKYFTQLAAESIGYVEQNSERIQELNLFIGQKTDRMDELNGKLNGRERPKLVSTHHLPRTITGLTLCIAMCVGNFFLIRESLQPSFKEGSWIAMGIFLAGMFSLFGRISMFHDTDSKVTWRPLLEEIGMPFAASLFVFASVLPHQTWLASISLFVFVFALFLFAGKLFLSNVTVLRTDWQGWLETNRNRTQYNSDSKIWERETLKLREEVDALRVKKWQAVRDLNAAETERDRIYAKRDMLVKLFESEFYLARRMKDQLTNSQLNLIQKGGQI